jgi:carbonic anhydrase
LTPDYASTVQALKSSESFYRYIGSLTTPPCTEGVRWLVAEKPIYTVTPTDLNAMMANWGFNSRDTKPLFTEHTEKLVHARTGLNYYNPPVGLGYTPSSNWSYEGIGGAERWNLYYPECKGNIQTPINIAPESEDFKTIHGLVKNNGLLPHVHYPHMEGEIKNKGGKTYQFTPHHGAGHLYRPDGVFDFAQLHIHLPSEHRVEEKDFVGEIHFVHTLGSSLAVLGGFMAISNVTDPWTKKFLTAAFPLGINDHAEFNTSFDEVVKKFEESPNYFKYVGSLTIPPCTEGVRWLIAEEPIFTISPADIKTYMDKIGFSARDTLPLRYEADYDWVAQRKGLEIFNPAVTPEALKSVPIPAEAMYEGFEGPQFWGFQNSQCDGMRQTPINCNFCM